MQEIILLDNQLTPSNLFVFNLFKYKAILITYVIIRGNLIESGNIHLTYNFIENKSNLCVISCLNSTGITFSSRYENNYLFLDYVSDMRNLNSIFKYNITYVLN